MSNSNDHIKRCLDYYLKKERFPDYAVLIKGSWGSGKTYFIRQYLEGEGAQGKRRTKVFDWLTGCKEYVVVYVSLYGTKSRQEMDDREQEILHPILNGKVHKLLPNGVLMVAGLASVLSGNPLPLAICKAGRPFAGALFKKLKDSAKKAVVVFDDVERADMPLTELLGYLNEYVEHLNIPCILLADKEKLEEAEDCQADKRTLQSISSTIEKVVGKEFQLSPAFDEVWDCWFNTDSSLLGDKAKAAMQNSKVVVSQILAASGKSNFRSLKHTLLDFQKFLHDVKQDCLSNQEFCKLLVADFVAHQYACHVGLLDPKKMSDLQTHETGLIIDAIENGAKSNQEQPDEQKTDDKRGYGNFMKTFDGVRGFTALNDTETAGEWFNIWKKWLQDSTMDSAQVNALIKRSIWYDGKNEYYLRKMLEWPMLNGEESRLAYDAFETSIASKKLTNPVLMMDLFVTMNWLIHEGALKESAAEFKTEMETYAQSVGKELEYADLEHWKERPFLNALYKVYETENDDFLQLLIGLLKERRDGNRARQEESFWRALSEANELDFRKACAWITSASSDFDLLSFAELNPEKFCQAYVSLGHNKQNLLKDSLKTRYAAIAGAEHAKRLNEERSFLEELKATANGLFEKARPVRDPQIFGLRYLIEDIEKILGVRAIGVASTPSEAHS